MANQVVLKQFQRALSQWPRDTLRPHVNFADVMQKRIESTPPTEAETNALLTLIESRYSRKYPLSRDTTNPTSDPEYYKRLMEELQNAPERTLFERISNRILGMVRMS